ncbi:MAG: hypothetical protein KDK99_21945 [Verrucomicrobiales bacterium]|nr:hypothetical protein [Verrucomicrobiales bacterium]
MKGLLLAIPSIGILMLKLGVPAEGNEMFPFHGELVQFLQLWWVSLLLLIIFPIGITMIFDVFHEFSSKLRSEQVVPSTGLVPVLRAVDDVVLRKHREIAKRLSGIRAVPALRCQLFDVVANPLDQIQHIVESLGHVLRTLTGDDSIRVVFIKIIENKCGYCYTYPEDRQVRPELLNEQFENTFFYRVYTKNDALIISDLERRSNRRSLRKSDAPYHFDREGAVPTGSIIGVPLSDASTQKVCCVVTVKSDLPNLIGPKFKKKFERIISMFTTRLNYEHTLWQLQQNAQQACPAENGKS